MGTATIACEISSEGKLSSVRVPSEGSMDIGVTPELIATAENADMLYFSSFMQGGRSSGAALRYILERTGPSFKIYDIECRVRLPTRDELVSGLSVASLVYTRGEDLPLLCELLGLPDLEPGLFASAITERFGPSYCVVADPYAGALISSIVGEQVGLDQVRESTVDIRGWHEAFLAALIHHIFGGSSLSTCCAAGMRYGDVVAALPGSMTKVHPTELMLVASSGT
jgi:sugar/nucleoside kinase (ribokinase family)